MKVIILVFSFLFAIQAISLSQVYPDKRQIQHYQEIIGLYPPELISGFPKTIENRMCVLMSLDFPRGKHISYIHIGLSLDDNEIRSLKMKLAKEAKRIYNMTDSCLMVIPYNYVDFRIDKSDSIQNCITPCALPISNFKRWGMRPEILPQLKIYVLNAKQGRFLEDGNLSRSGVGLPKEWLHGYTKGVTIFKNYAIYWLEVW